MPDRFPNVFSFLRRREIHPLVALFGVHAGRIPASACRVHGAPAPDGRPLCPGATAHGFSLVEVLVTLCVLAIGVMGAVGLQLSALRASQQSRYQTFATQLAVDIAERLRASGGTEEAALDIAATSVGSAPADTAAEGRGSCVDRACAAPIPMPEVALWSDRMRAELPAGRLRVCHDAHPWNAAGHAQWDCDGGPDDAVFVKVGWQDVSLRTHDGDMPPRLVMAIGVALSR